MDNKTNFYISGFISLSLFMLVAFFAIKVLFSTTKTNSYALKKDNYISVSVIIPKMTGQTSKQNKVININTLFNDVWTKKIVHTKHVKKIKDTRLIREIQKKINISKDNSVEPISKQIDNLKNIKTQKDEQSTSTALEVNEYLAKIQAIVYQYFRVPQNSEGNSVKTVIELNSLGKMIDFRVLTYSNNIALNEEADKIKNRLKNVVFPKNPQNQSSRTIVVLVSKE